MIGYFQVYLQTLITAGVTVEQYNTYITADLQLTQYEQDDIISKSLLFLRQVRVIFVCSSPSHFTVNVFQTDALQLKTSQLNFDFDFLKVYGVCSIFYVPLSASFTPLLCCHFINCGLRNRHLHQSCLLCLHCLPF